MKIPANTMSLQEGFLLFVAECEFTNRSKKTISSYTENMQRFIKFLSNHKEIQSPTLADYSVSNIEAYIRHIKKTGKFEDHPFHLATAEKKSDNTIKTYVRNLRVIGNWFYNNDLINEDISLIIKLPHAGKKLKRILTKDEIETIYSSFNTKSELGLRDLIIFILALELGIREGGIAHMQMRDVRIDSKIMVIQKKGGDTTYYPYATLVARYIREYILRYRSQANGNEPLLIDRNGVGISENTIKKMFHRLKKSTGIEHISCHNCRHTFATIYVEEGWHTIPELQIALGHTSPAMARKYVEAASVVSFASKEPDSIFERLDIKKRPGRA